MPPRNLRALQREEAALVRRLDDVQDKIMRLEALLEGRKPRPRRTRAKTTRRGRRSVTRRSRKGARR